MDGEMTEQDQAAETYVPVEKTSAPMSADAILIKIEEIKQEVKNLEEATRAQVNTSNKFEIESQPKEGVLSRFKFWGGKRTKSKRKRTKRKKVSLK